MGKKKIDWDLLEPKSWFLKKSNDDELGPMNESALRQLLAGGELEDSTLVRQGDSPFFPIDDVRELFSSIDEEGWYIIDQGLEYGPFMPKKVRALFECGLFNANTALIRQGSEGVLTTFETELTNSRSRVRQENSRDELRAAPTRAQHNGDRLSSAPMLPAESPTSLATDNSTSQETANHASSSPNEIDRVIHAKGRAKLSEDESTTRDGGQSDGLIASYLSNLDDFDRVQRAQRVSNGEDVYKAHGQEVTSTNEMQSPLSSPADYLTSEGALARGSRSATHSADATTQFCRRCGIEHSITDDRCEVCFRAMEQKIRANVPTKNAQATVPRISRPASFRLEGLNSKIAVLAAFATSGYFLSSWFTDAVLYRNYAGSSGVLNTWVPMVSGLTLAGLAGFVFQFDRKLREQSNGAVMYAAIFLLVAMVNYSIKKLDYREAESRVQEQQELWIKAMEGGDYQITPQEK